jgi:AbrB family looped-hinge helix DNA binding protein
MQTEATRVTSKYQTTIPKRIRRKLGVQSGDEVFWHTIREFVILDSHKRVKDPVKFLTSQMKLGFDAVKLVNSARSEIS